MPQKMTPATITDTAGFQSMVKVWNYVGAWENLDVIYDDLQQVPPRLRHYTVVRSEDPAEPYGALLQMRPPCANATAANSYLGKKLLAKVRLPAA